MIDNREPERDVREDDEDEQSCCDCSDKLAADSDSKEKPRDNSWTAKKGEKENVDQLTMHAVQTVPWDEFKQRNPDRDLSADKLADGKFKLWHATTGEVEDGWKVASSDGKHVRLSRDLSIDVKRRNHDGLVESLPGVPESFVKEIEDKLAELPANVRENLKRSGYKVICAPTIPDAIPALDKLTPRGWPKEMTFNNSDGTHDNVARLIIAPMRVKNGADWEPVTRPEVVVHQVGHALDHSNGMMSASKEFRQAFDADMKAIINQRDPRFKYFSQQAQGAGAQEGYASLFGLVLTGPENESDKEWLTKNFPNSIKSIKEQIKALR